MIENFNQSQFYSLETKDFKTLKPKRIWNGVVFPKILF